MKLFFKIFSKDDGKELRAFPLVYSGNPDEIDGSVVEAISTLLADYGLELVTTAVEAYSDEGKLLGRSFPVSFNDPCALKEAMLTACGSVSYAEGMAPGAQIFYINLDNDDIVSKSDHFDGTSNFADVEKSFDDIASSLEFAATERFDRYLLEVILKCPEGRIFCASLTTSQLFTEAGKKELQAIKQALLLHLKVLPTVEGLKGETITYLTPEGEEVDLERVDDFIEEVEEVPDIDDEDDLPSDFLAEVSYKLPVKIVYRRNGVLRNSVYENLASDSIPKLKEMFNSLVESENCF